MGNLWTAVVLLLAGVGALSALIVLNSVPFSLTNWGLALSAVLGLIASGIFAGRI